MRSRIPRLLLHGLRRVAIYYLLLVLGMTFIERWLVYPAPSVSGYDWSPGHLRFEDAWFIAEDGARLHGWFFEHPSPAATVLYFHGNGEHVAHAGELMPMIVDQLDASVLVFDYRGYGKSEGKPFETGLIQDARAASDWLAERTGVRPPEQVLIGRSIGGGVAVALAAERGAKCLVLQSTFARLTDPAAQLYPWLPVRLLMRNRFDSIDRIQDYSGPVFSTHGTEDTMVPIANARRLFDAAPTKIKQFLTVRGMDHNEPLKPAHWQALRRFLNDLPVDQ